jgi:hypothetical protein
MEWEYLVRIYCGSKSDHQDMINKLGADGWELVTIWDGLFHFKRPLVSTKKEKY